MMKNLKIGDEGVEGRVHARASTFYKLLKMRAVYVLVCVFSIIAKEKV